MYAVIRISSGFIPLIDKLIEQEHDGFGRKKYPNRRCVADRAIEEFLQKNAPSLLNESEEQEALVHE